MFKFSFTGEAIDGESLMALTSDDLRKMNLRLGHKKKIELMILSLKEKLQGDNAVPGCGASVANHEIKLTKTILN